MTGSWPVRIAFVVFVLITNVLAFVLPIDYGRLGELSYLGAFALTLIANATIIVPIPYWPIFGHLAATAPVPVLVVVAGSVGSAIGESVAFGVGRAGQDAARESRLYRWVERFAHRPLLVGLLIFGLAIPINPFFDVAGIAAGALGVRYRVFVIAVLLGRGVRFALLAYFALRLAGG